MLSAGQPSIRRRVLARVIQLFNNNSNRLLSRWDSLVGSRVDRSHNSKAALADPVSECKPSLNNSRIRSGVKALKPQNNRASISNFSSNRISQTT